MLKTLLTLIATLLLATTAAFAAVDVNTATEAELDGIKGIGPGLSGRILEERKSAPFKDWADFIGRVGKGVGNKSAVNFSKEGLTVNGKKYSAAAAAKAEAKSKQKDKEKEQICKPPGQRPQGPQQRRQERRRSTPTTPSPGAAPGSTGPGPSSQR